MYNQWQTASLSNSFSCLHTSYLHWFIHTFNVPRSLPTSLLQQHTIPFSFRISINLVQFTQSNAFCHSMKQAHISSFLSKVCSDIILSTPIASQIPSLLNPNWSLKYNLNVHFSPSSKYPGYCLCCMCSGRCVL